MESDFAGLNERLDRWRGISKERAMLERQVSEGIRILREGKTHADKLLSSTPDAHEDVWLFYCKWVETAQIVLEHFRQSRKEGYMPSQYEKFEEAVLVARSICKKPDLLK